MENQEFETKQSISLILNSQDDVKPALVNTIKPKENLHNIPNSFSTLKIKRLGGIIKDEKKEKEFTLVPPTNILKGNNNSPSQVKGALPRLPNIIRGKGKTTDINNIAQKEHFKETMMKRIAEAKKNQGIVSSSKLGSMIPYQGHPKVYSPQQIRLMSPQMNYSTLLAQQQQQNHILNQILLLRNMGMIQNMNMGVPMIGMGINPTYGAGMYYQPNQFLVPSLYGGMSVPNQDVKRMQTPKSQLVSPNSLLHKLQQTRTQRPINIASPVTEKQKIKQEKPITSQSLFSPPKTSDPTIPMLGNIVPVDKMIHETARLIFYPFHFGSRRNRKNNFFPFHEIGKDVEEREKFGNSPYYKYTMKIRFHIKPKVKSPLDFGYGSNKDNSTFSNSHEDVYTSLKHISLFITENELNMTKLPDEFEDHQKQIRKEKDGSFSLLYGFAIPKEIVSKTKKMEKNNEEKRLYQFIIKHKGMEIYKTKKIVVVSKLNETGGRSLQIKSELTPELVEACKKQLVALYPQIFKESEENKDENKLVYNIFNEITSEKGYYATVTIHQFRVPSSYLDKCAFVEGFKKYINDNFVNFQYIKTTKKNIILHFKPKKDKIEFEFACTNKNRLENRLNSFRREMSWESSKIRQINPKKRERSQRRKKMELKEKERKKRKI